MNMTKHRGAFAVLCVLAIGTAAGGVLIAISTDAHSTGELGLIRCGIDQARRAGLEKSAVLNCQPWEKLQRLFKR